MKFSVFSAAAAALPPIDEQQPAEYPRVDLTAKRAVLHGFGDWAPLLEPLDDDLRTELLKYGDFTQATYDGFDTAPYSKYCGSCHYGLPSFFTRLGLAGHHYVATAYIYAMGHIALPRWLEKSLHADKWDVESNWMGYVAVADADETARIGYRDIVVAWRGTIQQEEWLKNTETRLVPVHAGEAGVPAAKATADGRPMVERGFHSIFTGKKDGSVFNKLSAKEQVIGELGRLIPHFQSLGDEVCITVVGHSLGGALAQLCASEAAAAFPGVPVKSVTFASPRVGNQAFCDLLAEQRVKAVRMVVEDDVVPDTPGLQIDISPCSWWMMKLGLRKPMELTYKHYGPELRLAVASSPYLKTKYDTLGFHNLEMHLHLLDGYKTKKGDDFRKGALRDPTLVNKSSAMLRNELLIPESWYQPPNKGLVRNTFGRYTLTNRDPADVPVADPRLPLSDIP